MVILRNVKNITDYLEREQVDAILEDIIEADAEIDDAAGIGMTINENIELELEVTTE